MTEDPVKAARTLTEERHPDGVPYLLAWLTQNVSSTTACFGQTSHRRCLFVLQSVEGQSLHLSIYHSKCKDKISLQRQFMLHQPLNRTTAEHRKPHGVS